MIRYTTQIRVRYRDTDQMGVVYHGVYLEFFETGRTEFLRDAGMAYSSIEDTGIMLPVLEATLTMKRPARYDDLLTVHAIIREMPTARLKIEYEIYRNDEPLVFGHTIHAFVTAGSMRPVRPPHDFVDTLARLMGET
ncbi:MAG: acyl-CoA thioesterase [Ignavibacteriae bacterium]|nr:acyl-CoA thioesterase [Ignavibacteriota bacterium]MCB9216411.1 acyl-CoA thioesterase [Ignavibacteria bacterium]